MGSEQSVGSHRYESEEDKESSDEDIGWDLAEEGASRVVKRNAPKQTIFDVDQNEASETNRLTQQATDKQYFF